MDITMQAFLNTYQKLTAANLDTLADIYTPDIHFVDPVHEIRGLVNLTRYFEGLYANITAINFSFFDPIFKDTNAYVQWRMTFRHPHIKKEKEVIVAGATFLRFAGDQKVSFHRDYFDLGQMIYQHLPLMGRIVDTINRRLRS